MLKIGLDFDGVITDCGELKELAAKELYGLDVPRAHFKKEILVKNGVMTLDQYRQLQTTIYNNYEWGARMHEVDGVKVWIEKNKDSFEICIVTSRYGESLDVARGWLNRNSIDVPIVGVDYGNTKEEATLGFDIFVDDDLDKLEPLIDSVPNLFLFSWPYNEQVNLPDSIKRVKDWEGLSEKISVFK